MSALSSMKIATLLPLVAVAGCAGLSQPYAQIDGRKYHAVAPDTYSVQILRVDNRDTTDNPVFVDPGQRKVTVQGPPDGVHRFAEQRAIDLNVAPCTRYYLVAVKLNRLMTDYSVKVDHEEPIAGCSAAAPQ